MLVGGFYVVEGSLNLFWVTVAGVMGNMVGSWIAAIIVTAGLIVGALLAPPGAPIFIGVIALIWFALRRPEAA